LCRREEGSEERSRSSVFSGSVVQRYVGLVIFCCGITNQLVKLFGLS
jgi:hypothetical protein